MKSIRDAAERLRAYAKIAEDTRLEADAHEIRRRAERKLGEMMKVQSETVGLSKGAREPGTNRGTTRVTEKPASPVTLRDAGIDKNLAHAARKAAAMPEEKFEATVASERDAIEHRQTVIKPRGTQGTGNNEWYTPLDYIELAREVMGDIDLDPAMAVSLASSCQNASRFLSLLRGWRPAAVFSEFV